MTAEVVELEKMHTVLFNQILRQCNIALPVFHCYLLFLLITYHSISFPSLYMLNITDYINGQN